MTPLNGDASPAAPAVDEFELHLRSSITLLRHASQAVGGGGAAAWLSQYLVAPAGC
jgi:hypothetical protein